MHTTLLGSVFNIFYSKYFDQGIYTLTDTAMCELLCVMEHMVLSHSQEREIDSLFYSKIEKTVCHFPFPTFNKKRSREDYDIFLS